MPEQLVAGQSGAGVPKIQPRKNKGDKSLQSTTYEFPYMRKKENKSLGKIIYDSDNGSILGRTPESWAKIIAFYAIFYIALAALFAICMKGLLSTISDDHPKWQLHESLIGTNPGLGFRPMAEEVEQGSLIWYDVSNATQIKTWSNILDDFLAPYNDSKLLSNGGQNQKHCDFESYPRDDQVCALDITQLKECSSNNGYGFNKSAPCVFLKLNRIFGWKPEFYNDIDDLPESMPDTLKEHIKSLDVKKRNQIWVTCGGESPADQEIIGDVEYFPTQGFPGYYYPFKNTPGYLSPLVAVKFIRPKPNQIINIECRSWAKNIEYNGSHRDRKGSVHFEIMIDAPIQ